MLPPFPSQIRSAVLLALVVSCGGPTKKVVAPKPPGLERSELGGMRNVSAVDGVWIGGLPSIEDLDLARRRGIGRVIDLCVPEEQLDYDLRAECARLGLECVTINLRASDDLPDSVVDLVLESLEEPPDRKLLFCGDGSRSAMFFAIYRVVRSGLDVEDALHEARRAGMQPGTPETFVRAQVVRLGGAAAR